MRHLFIRATNTDASRLTDLAVQSESHWNLADDLMLCFREQYAITKEFIEHNYVYKLEIDRRILGFFALMPTRPIGILEYFYLEPIVIGTGLGKQMWHKLLDLSSSLDINIIEFVCGPEPLPFYLKIGATIINEEQSRLSKDRKNYRLLYSLPNATTQLGQNRVCHDHTP